MESICSIDSQFSHEISALLETPSALQQQEYFDNLLRTRQCRGLKVKHQGELGKGVYANLDFGEGELVLKDQMLLGAQHSSNKIDCLVCSYCFCFIGSIELQIGRRLYLQGLRVSTSNSCGRETFLHNSHARCEADSSEDEDNCYMEEHDELGGCTSGVSKVPLPEGVAESLMNSASSLPFSEKFPLPSTIACPGGCGEAYYCSKLCAESDWESSHSLLCTGEKSESICREALSKFIQHANETNDIFLLAAKVICFTILRYQKLKTAHLREQENFTPSVVLKNDGLPLLLEAWKPISMGYKKRWWDCIALPDDVDSCDEAAFRAQIKELAFTSLKLLKEAIFCKGCEPLFSLEIYGQIIGMFELNNLDLVVASPVEDYFLYIDELPNPEKEKAEEITRPFLDALGDDYSVPCQGTAFFPLQSCMNHSCYPNAKAFKREEDRDGQATIIALRRICKEEEVTISYIDEDLPYDERQALLADYGFRCKCPKCLEEEP